MWEELSSRIAALIARWSHSAVGERLAARRRAAGARISPLRGRLRRLRTLLAGRLPLVGRLPQLRRRRRPAAYRDGRVTLDERGVVLHNYYFPFGSKRIRYADVRGVQLWPLTGARAFRVHGPGWPRVWYQRDPRRGERSVGILFDVGRWWRPVASAEKPDVVLEAVARRADSGAHGPRRRP